MVRSKNYFDHLYKVFCHVSLCNWTQGADSCGAKRSWTGWSEGATMNLIMASDDEVEAVEVTIKSGKYGHVVVIGQIYTLLL